MKIKRLGRPNLLLLIEHAIRLNENQVLINLKIHNLKTNSRPYYKRYLYKY